MPFMLIGIDASRALRAQRTGTETYSLQLIRHLLALNSPHQFRLYCDRPFPATLQDIAGSDQVEIRVIPFPRLWTHLRLSAEVLARPPDVLFVPAHVLPLLHPRRSVVTVHDLGYYAFPQAHRRLSRWYLRAGTRFSARTARHVLTDSQATKDDLQRHCAVDPVQVTVVPLGRDEALAPVTDTARLLQLQERLGVNRDGTRRRYLLYVGTLQPRKNLTRVIDAFAVVRTALPDLCLVLAGQRGWLSEPVFQRVEKLGLQQDVLFPGYVSADDLPALLSGALALVFPSLYEGFGFPVLEAQACGVPVLTSTTSSLPEVAGDSALLVDPTDTEAIAAGLRQLATDAALRNRLSVAGFVNIRRFSWERCARETLQVLERVAAGDL
jgi:glycosyltransferase involved in cell wall biosynthesis